jgi:hypothetical protein
MLLCVASANASSSIAFEITLEKKEVGRNVPMSIKKLVFSFKLVANLLQLVDKRTELTKN